MTKEYPQSQWWAPGGFSSLQFGHFILMQDPSEVNISSLICYRRVIVVTLRLWTLRVHPLNDEICAPSIKKSPIKPFASSPTEFVNCAPRGAGRRSAWRKRRIYIEPTWAASSARFEMSRCGTSLSLRTHYVFPSRSCFAEIEDLASRTSIRSASTAASVLRLCRLG